MKKDHSEMTGSHYGLFSYIILNPMHYRIG
nr:MAG TPA: hypothetical protein [Caudoviricetes sp.]